MSDILTFIHYHRLEIALTSQKNQYIPGIDEADSRRFAFDCKVLLKYNLPRRMFCYLPNSVSESIVLGGSTHTRICVSVVIVLDNPVSEFFSSASSASSAHPTPIARIPSKDLCLFDQCDQVHRHAGIVRLCLARSKQQRTVKSD